MALTGQEKRTGMVAVIICDDARAAAGGHDGLLIDAPMALGDVVKAWSGADGREEIAAALLERAREALRIQAPAGSIIERAWQVDGAGHETELARSMMQAEPAAPARTVGAALEELRRRGLGEVERFEHVAKLWGNAGEPIIIIARDEGPVISATIRSLVGAVEFSAAGQLILLVEPQAWCRLLRELDEHTLAILRENVRTDRRRMEPIVELRERARQAVTVAKAVTPVVADRLPEEYSAARSLAEALLYAALQADSRTTGLFCLNAGGGFDFGPREVEIDLLCAALKVAIEVDGYFHFQDSTAYRRDRAKDWLMQRHGLLVLRFLAEDVPDELEAVLDRVAEAVNLRRKGQAR